MILAIGVRANDSPAETAASLGIEAIIIGDAKQPRKISDAIREGFETGLSV